MRFKAKPLRSVLFVPGNKEDWMRKAPQYGPDALILDLEDSVPEEGKAEARTLVRQMVEELGSAGRTLFVRVNRLETGLTGLDLEAVTCPQLYGILLPKVQHPSDVVEVDNLLNFFEGKAGMKPGQVCLEPSLETAQGIRQAYEIAMAAERVAHMGGSGGKGGRHGPIRGFSVDAGRFGNPVYQVQGAAGLPGRRSGIPSQRRLVMDIHNRGGFAEPGYSAEAASRVTPACT